MDIRQRLHLSGMDSHAPELARKWGLGLEVTDFCYAPMLDDPATLPAVREKMAGIDPCKRSRASFFAPRSTVASGRHPPSIEEPE